jgi:antirestriction protein
MKTLDTRDLYKRKCELESLRDAVTTAREELEEKKGILAALEETPEDEASEAALEIASEEVTDAESNLEAAESDFGNDEKEELDELETLENEISEFKHGETMIPENDFEDYARELAEDIGAISGNEEWPCNCIDWERAARELVMDYSTVEYQGDTYLVRN